MVLGEIFLRSCLNYYSFAMFFPASLLECSSHCTLLCICVLCAYCVLLLHAGVMLLYLTASLLYLQNIKQCLALERLLVLLCCLEKIPKTWSFIKNYNLFLSEEHWTSMFSEHWWHCRHQIPVWALVKAMSGEGFSRLQDSRVWLCLSEGTAILSSQNRRGRRHRWIPSSFIKHWSCP